MTRAVVERNIPRRELYRVNEAVVLLNLSRSQLYELIRSGRIQSVTEGRVRLIPADGNHPVRGLLVEESDDG